MIFDEEENYIIGPSDYSELKDKPIQHSKFPGRKDSKEKAPIYTFCKQFKLAIEQLALRSKYGHEKYLEQDGDWQNFTRVDNPDYEYGNAEFRHALGLGDDEDELQHYVATAWNSIARLEMYLKNNQ